MTIAAFPSGIPSVCFQLRPSSSDSQTLPFIASWYMTEEVSSKKKSRAGRFGKEVIVCLGSDCAMTRPASSSSDHRKTAVRCSGAIFCESDIILTYGACNGRKDVVVGMKAVFLALHFAALQDTISALVSIIIFSLWPPTLPFPLFTASVQYCENVHRVTTAVADTRSSGCLWQEIRFD